MLAGQVVAFRVAGDPVTANNGLFFIYGDHLGSTTMLGTSSGGMVAGSLARYRPYGSYRTTPTQTLTDRDFTGQRENRELGLLYYNARFYHPGIGRFISPDSLIPDPANPQSLNRYSYVNNNSVKHIDPSGHCVLGLPCPKSVENGIVAVNDFLLGAEAQWIYHNTLGLAKNLEATPGESAAMTAGRVAGDIVTVVQGVQEAISGGGAMAGGAAVCLTGVGCLATPVVELIGAAAAAHGVTVAAHGVAGLVENSGAFLSETISSHSGGGSKPLQTGGHTFQKSTAKGLNQQLGTDYSAKEWGKALEELKKDNLFRGKDHGRIMDNGAWQVQIDGKWVDIGFIQDYLP